MSVSVQSIQANYNSKLKTNYFKHSNIIDDVWAKELSPVKYSVVRQIFRMTYGWQKKIDKLSISQLSKRTGYSRSTVIKAIKELITEGKIGKLKTGQNGLEECHYYLIFNEDSNISYQYENCTTPPSENRTHNIKDQEIKKGRKKGASPSTPPAPLFSKDQVRIKQSTYDALVQEYKEPIVAMAIDRMNAYMQKTGRYKQYKCHGAKLRHWLTQDADKYEIKLKKQTQEMDSQKEYARWLQAQEERKIEKEKQQKLQADQEKVLIERHMPILQKYIQKFPNVVKMSKYIQNGICELVDSSNTIHYLMMTQTDFEPQLTRKIDEFGYSHGFN